MGIWTEWWKWAGKLRKSCARERTFMWLLVAIVGFSIRDDLLGVSSFIRCMGLQGLCYDRLLDFFHTPALCVVELARIWTLTVFECHPGIVRCNGRPVLVCDGIKIGKSGKKMPGVKLLHQESDSNTKPEYIMGHSCQAVCVLVECLASVAAVPLAARIHEGGCLFKPGQTHKLGQDGGTALRARNKGEVHTACRRLLCVKEDYPAAHRKWMPSGFQG